MPVELLRQEFLSYKFLGTCTVAKYVYKYSSEFKNILSFHYKLGSFLLEHLGNCSIAWGCCYLCLSPRAVIIAAPDY